MHAGDSEMRPRSRAEPARPGRRASGKYVTTGHRRPRDAAVRYRPTRCPVITSHGPCLSNEVTWIDGDFDAMVNGCDQSTCRGGCNKDLRGIVIDGHTFRFAACQFGQKKTAGSPLGRLVPRLSDQLHVAAWVDDLLLIMSTPVHVECAGFDGGCEVCVESHGKALKIQEAWLEKARALNIPLSAKGHTVGQRGAYTRVAIDTFAGCFSMPEKLQSMTDARNALASSPLCTTERHTIRRRCRTIAFAAHAQPRDRHGLGGNTVAGGGQVGKVRLGSGGARV